MAKDVTTDEDIYLLQESWDIWISCPCFEREDEAEYNWTKEQGEAEADEFLNEWEWWLHFGYVPSGDVIILEAVGGGTNILRFSSDIIDGYSISSDEPHTHEVKGFDIEFLEILENTGYPSIKAWKSDGYPPIMDRSGHTIKKVPVYSFVMVRSGY